MKNYQENRELELCLFNDNIWCNSVCTIFCYYHPLNRIRNAETENNLHHGEGEQITIEELLNEEKKD